MNPEIIRRPRQTVAVSATVADTSPFAAIMELDYDGTPIWRARRLMQLMGYPRWADFQRVLTRAMTAAGNTGSIVEEVFRRSPENPSEAGGRPREDFKLTRDAAYFTAMNGDPNKTEVAAAQLYFVEQAKKQEAAERAVATDDLSVLEGVIQAIRVERIRLAAVEAVQSQQAIEQAELRARMDGIEGQHDWFSALAYAKMNGLSTELSFLRKFGTAAGRITRRDGYEPKRTQHALFGAVNMYPLSALDETAELLAVRS